VRVFCTVDYESKIVAGPRFSVEDAWKPSLSEAIGDIPGVSSKGRLAQIISTGTEGMACKTDCTNVALLNCSGGVQKGGTWIGENGLLKQSHQAIGGIPGLPD
jgi:hypothetical protein